MKHLILIIAVAVLVLVVKFVSMRSNYSPMDSYCNAVVKNTADSTRHAEELNQFLNK